MSTSTTFKVDNKLFDGLLSRADGIGDPLPQVIGGHSNGVKHKGVSDADLSFHSPHVCPYHILVPTHRLCPGGAHHRQL